MSMHLESIQRFDADAKQSTVDNIVKHLGIALHSNDGATVAMSDEQEVNTIRDGFCAKKLDLDADEATKAIQEVGETLKHDAAKCRVTFYYLLAKNAGKLGQFE